MSDIYTNALSVVVKKEKKYLEKRRDTNGIERDAPIAGLCISGGGIRSATLGLGMMQALMKEDVFKCFDYMSTVSGGGYIGSCLTSLLTNRRSTKNPSDIGAKEDPEYASQVGLDKDNSPFVGLHEDMNEPQYPVKAKLCVMHQIHHLRTHGDYLVMRKGLTSSDVQRAVGVFFSGLIHNVLMILLIMAGIVAAVHFVLSVATSCQFLTLMSGWGADAAAMTNGSGLLETFSEYASICIYRPLSLVFKESSENLSWLSAFAVAGIAWGIVALVLACIRSKAITAELASKESGHRSGQAIDDQKISAFICWFNWVSIGVVIVGATICGCILSIERSNWSVFALPVAFAMGGRLSSLMVGHVILSNECGRVCRSLVAAIQGASGYGLVLSVLIPLTLLVFVTLGLLDSSVWVAILILLIKYVVIGQVLGEKTGNRFTSWITTHPKFVVGLLVFFFIGLTSGVISNGLSRLYPVINGLFVQVPSGCEMLLGPTVVVIVTGLLVCLGGWLVDSNRISPHYFYRDRLAEAFLRTDARVKRDDSCKYQGQPLICLRNDEDMTLKGIGSLWVDGAQEAERIVAPYHIIVTSLNLLGTDELNRKTMLSDHFIFSKYYVGSSLTGYVATDVYRDGETRLARAMTISGAAASSAMGGMSFFAQTFAMTLFNIRLGYWMANPWKYCDIDKQIGKSPNLEKYTFWPKYLHKELWGNIDARGDIVHLSDGGHTGDNLGLMPLVQRRCKLIVVCDFEQDPNYEFDSFNNAVRMAYIEENIQIEIDLREIVPSGDGKEKGLSRKSVVAGVIRYPDKDGIPAFNGNIIYIKSSLSEPDGKKKLPVHVLNYKTSNVPFPHQSTGDQFFDDAQFEAYRALGEHMGVQALRYL